MNKQHITKYYKERREDNIIYHYFTGSHREPTKTEIVNYINDNMRDYFSGKILIDMFVMVDDEYIPPEESRTTALREYESGEKCPICGHEQDLGLDACPVCGKEW